MVTTPRPTRRRLPPPSTPAPTESEPTSEPTDVATEDPEPESPDVPGGVVLVGDKSVMLDGFVGVRIPEGWSITAAEVPLLSSAPPGETDLDASALAQSLVINPDASPRGATFSLVHYEHSNVVPSLGRFDSAVADLLSGDGSQIADSSEVTIGGQGALLHQVKSASGANGVLVTLKSGDEYFFILSLVSESAYAADTGEMLSSVSFVPEALHN